MTNSSDINITDSNISGGINNIGGIQNFNGPVTIQSGNGSYTEPSLLDLSQKHCKNFSAHSLEEPISRDTLLEQLFQFSVSGDGVVVGPPGVGKSYLLHQLSQRLMDHGHPCICLSVAGRRSRDELKTVFGIHVDLIDYLKSAIPQLNGAIGIVLIDGYDAARSTETQVFFRMLITEMIRELQPYWRIVVSIRTYDAQKSINFLDLFPSKLDITLQNEYQVKDIRCRHFAIPLLTIDEVQNAVGKIGALSAIYPKISEGFRQLLRIPFNLWLIERLLKDRPSLPTLGAITSETELLSLYWKYRIEDHELGHQMIGLLTDVTSNMVENRELVVGRHILSTVSQSSQAIDELLSREMLRYSSALHQSLEFVHNILFDYAVACLLIADDPDKFVEFFKADYFKPIFLLPSIEFYFSYLWLFDPDLFWKVFWRIYSSDIEVHLKLFARLIPPRIIVSQLERFEQLQPLVEAQLTLSPLSSIAIAATLRMLLTREVKNPTVWSSFLNSIVSSVTREFVVDFSKALDELICIGNNEKNIAVLKQCGSTARALTEWILTERDSSTRSWLDNVGSRSIYPLIAKTFATDVSASRLLIRRIIMLVQNREAPLNYLNRLVDLFDEIVTYDPQLIAEIYELVFLSNELGDGEPFVGGIIVQLVVSAQDERGMLEHSLVRYYPRFLELHLALSISVGIKCINSIVNRDSVRYGLVVGLNGNKEAQNIRFREGNAVYQRDAYYWSVTHSSQDHEPIHIVEYMFDHIARLASENRLDLNTLNILLDLFRDYAQVAYLWARLLNLGTRYPEIFAGPLFELVINEPILYGNDLVQQLGGFLEATSQFYPPQRMQTLEEAIVVAPKREKDLRRLNVLEDHRNFLLARIPSEKLVTEEAKQLKVEIEKVKDTYRYQPLFANLSLEGPLRYDEDSVLAEQGIDLLTEGNQQVRDAYDPLKGFKEQWNNRIPDEDAVASTLPAVRFLYSVLDNESTQADEVVARMAWTHLGDCIALMCLSPENNTKYFDFFKEIMIACAKHPCPEPDPGYDAAYNFPSWPLAPRTAAAQGLLTLSYYQVDLEVLQNIQILSRDPVPSVRYLVARRLFWAHHSSDEFFWHCVRERVENETNAVVLNALYGSIMRQGIRETQPAQDLLYETISNLLVTAPDGALIEELIKVLPWYMFIVQANWALNVCTGIIDNPVQYARTFSVLFFRMLESISPDVLFSTEGGPVAQRTIEWIKNALEVARTGIVELIRNAQKNGWTGENGADLKHLQSVIDHAVNDLYFKHDIPGPVGRPSNKQPLSDEIRRKFYFAVKDILFQLSQLALDDSLGIIPAHTAYQFMQLMNGVLPYDPVVVLEMTMNMAKSSKTSGFQFDGMAIGEVVKLIETLLADYQDKLRDGTALENMIVLLDIFVEAGWSEALDLVGRLSEIAR